jgi:hypothetical protein
MAGHGQAGLRSRLLRRRRASRVRVQATATYVEIQSTEPTYRLTR